MLGEGKCKKGSQRKGCGGKAKEIRENLGNKYLFLKKEEGFALDMREFFLKVGP